MSITSSTTGLSGRSVVVTGAGSGIGRAAALRFAAEGARVVLADLNADAAKAVAEEISEAGGTAVTVIGDLSDQQVVDQVVATAVGSFGGIDVLVNNAGVMDRMSAAADTEDDEWERVLRINLTAPFLLSRAALPHLLASGNAAIVFTASEASLRGSAAGAAYTASKHGVAGLTKSLAVMYRDEGVRTNAIAPGGTVTGIQVDVDREAHGPSVVMRHMGNAGRTATADEQAAAIVFLASDAASNVNGVILPVDNGWSAV
ncbi:SDR family NAD(P)-dependent oxidoreductase [Streptomyces sp. NPDC048484]|uniref:SDR family NAD(P)-dependent oxidoreductase n=1 Tax=Streptomyces sp. NPDC048484 TaxID=3155146 RepID=UPI003434BE54